METLKTDVIIVGAGPTGLSLAVQLTRFGVPFVLMDKKEGVTDLSKAMVVHARTLEIYDQCGLAETAVEQGEIAHNILMMHDGEVRARLDFSDVGGDLSPFPFVLVFEQSKNERLLADYLQQAGKSIHWQTELESLTQDKSGVRGVIKTAEGAAQTVEARYLVGCDGARSATRHLLNLQFEGSTFPRLFYVADVDMEFEAEPGSVYASFGPDAFVLLFPLQGEKHWRLIGPLPEYEQAARSSAGEQLNIPFEAVEKRVKSLIQRPLNIINVRWFSNYKVHTRHTRTFVSGRCFLAGDAAHVHTPAGGQGMNTGIQDAYNLAWKLALVLHGQADESLLDTYNEERLANARRLLRTTDQLFEVAANDHWPFQFFRDHILPGLAGFFFRFDAAKEFLFPTFSQIAIHYRESALSRHEGDHPFKVKAGDRLPYFQVNNESVYDRLRTPKFHLLVFAGAEHAYDALVAEINSRYSALMDVSLLPLSPRVIELFGSHQPFMTLVRPDNHIAFLSQHVALHDLQTYLQSILKSATI